MQTRPQYAFLLVFALILTGCGDGNPLNRQAVTGEITYGGEPLAHGSIEFTPQGEGIASGAKIEVGKFAVPEDKGLPPGDYLVRISASDETAELVEMPGESRQIAAELIPAKCNKNSTETFTVKAGEDNVYKLDIEATE